MVSTELAVDGASVEAAARQSPVSADPADPRCADERQSAYARVTIAGDRRRVDVAVPLRVPLAELLPQIVELCVPHQDRASPHHWVLARIGSAPLDPEVELGSAGLAHGEVLILTTEADDLRPAHVDDVRDATEDLVDETGASWHGRAHLRCLLGLLAAVALGVGIAGLAGAIAPALAAVAALVFVPALWLAADWMRRLDEVALAVVLVTLTCGWAGLLGWCAPWWHEVGAPAAGSAWLTAIRPVVAASASTVAAVLLRNVSPVATGVAAAAGVGVVASLPLAAGTVMQFPAPAGVGVCAAVAILGVGLLPRVAVSVGGLTDLDRQARSERAVSRSILAARVDTAAAVLTGCLVGLALVAVAASTFLSSRADPWPRLLGVVVALGLLTRSRLFSRLTHVLILRLAAMAGCAATVIRLVLDSPTVWVSGGLLAGGVAMLLGVAAMSVRPVTDVGTARLTRAASAVEWCVIASLVPLLAGVWGLFTRVSELVR